MGPTDASVPNLEVAVAFGGKVAARQLVIGAVRADLHAGRKGPIDAACTPSATRMARARAPIILVARDHAAGNGHGAEVVWGAMIDAAKRHGAADVLFKVKDVTWI